MRNGYRHKVLATLPPFTAPFLTKQHGFLTPPNEESSSGSSDSATNRDNYPPQTATPKSWSDWLRSCGPRTFTGEFASFHVEFWDWNWRLLLAAKRGETISDEDQAFLALWFRGAGKSSHVEWAAIAEGAILGAGYVLYVSGTQALAEGHVAAIRERLESEEIAERYPHLASPQIGRHGNQFGWRQNFLRTSGGWAIRPVGLDVGVRGGRVGDMRPSLIIFDDVDDHADSPATVEKKEDVISRSILPAGTGSTRLFFAQNLIHRNSVANRIYTRKSGLLARRIVSGPFQAFEGLEIETRQTGEGPREVITAGTPTWSAIDLKACQNFLDNSGRPAFLAEYQHDFAATEQGRVLPEYREDLHVITWSQFERVYGSRFIPQHWEKEIGHDVGYTKGHLSAWVWIATSSINSGLPGLRFRYRGRTFVSTLLDDQAEEVTRLMKDGPHGYDEAATVQRWVMSHEALSERATYNVKFNLPFMACKFGKTAGLAQWRHYLRADRTKAHPFHEDAKGEDGLYRLGCPSWFDVVDDDQLLEPRDDAGLKLFREQAISWKWKPTPLTDSGMTKDEPVKADEDTADATRMITSLWGPQETPLTEKEKPEMALPKGLREEVIAQARPGFQRDMAGLMRDFRLSERKREQGRTGANWTHEVLDPTDDPWNDR